MMLKEGRNTIPMLGVKTILHSALGCKIPGVSNPFVRRLEFCDDEVIVGGFESKETIKIGHLIVEKVTDQDIKAYSGENVKVRVTDDKGNEHEFVVDRAATVAIL